MRDLVDGHVATWIFRFAFWGEDNASSVAMHQYTADGMQFIRRWGCMMDVQRGPGHNNISKVCLGKRNTAGGYHWRYEDEERDAESESKIDGVNDAGLEINGLKS